jgi:hypothetical protein
MASKAVKSVRSASFLGPESWRVAIYLHRLHSLSVAHLAPICHHFHPVGEQDRLAPGDGHQLATARATYSACEGRQHEGSPSNSTPDLGPIGSIRLFGNAPIKLRRRAQSGDRLMGRPDCPRSRSRAPSVVSRLAQVGRRRVDPRLPRRGRRRGCGVARADRMGRIVSQSRRPKPVPVPTPSVVAILRMTVSPTPSSCDAGSTALTHAGFRGRAACRSAEGRATGARDQLAAMCAATALQAGLERTSWFARS